MGIADSNFPQGAFQAFQVFVKTKQYAVVGWYHLINAVGKQKPPIHWGDSCLFQGHESVIEIDLGHVVSFDESDT